MALPCRHTASDPRCERLGCLGMSPAVALAVASLAAWGRSAGYRDTDDEPTAPGWGPSTYTVPQPESGSTRRTR